MEWPAATPPAGPDRLAAAAHLGAVGCLPYEYVAGAGWDVLQHTAAQLRGGGGSDGRSPHVPCCHACGLHGTVPQVSAAGKKPCRKRVLAGMNSSSVGSAEFANEQGTTVNRPSGEMGEGSPSTQ